MNKIISQNMDKIKTLCKKHKVETLYLFGSASSGDNFSAKSDIDLLISFKPMDCGEYSRSYFTIADRFEKIFHRNVDLVTTNSLTNPYFIKSVNKTKVLLYEG